jgi:hypothetical protein
MVDVTRNLVESFKKYLQLSLTYSSHQALREHACLGGTIGDERNHWICNGPNPVPVEVSKNCLELYTLYYLNEYSSLFNTSLPVKIIKQNFTDLLYGVDEREVLNPPSTYDPFYDEGNFWVNSTGAKILLTGDNIQAFEGISTQDFISRNRYWYMFRIFTEWANDDVFSPCICGKIGCSCTSTSDEESCSSCSAPVEECAKMALEDLQKRFDKADTNVTCKMSRECCRQGVGPPCGSPNACLPWKSRCAALCTHTCVDPKISARACPLSSSFSSSSTALQADDYFYLVSYNKNPYMLYFQSLVCKCDYWYEGRIAAIYTYSCEDHKYYVPSDKGPVPLTFSVNALASWRNPQACYSQRTCPCPDSATTCSECDNSGCCTPCY